MNPQIAKNKYAPGTSRGSRSARTLALQMAMEAEKQAAVGRRLKELRGVRTQQPIADFVGVTLRAYQAWEAGDSGISWPHIEKLAEYHEVSENYILYGDDAGPRQPIDRLERIEEKVSELHELLLGDGHDAEAVAGLAARLLQAAGLPQRSAADEPKTARAGQRRRSA